MAWDTFVNQVIVDVTSSPEMSSTSVVALTTTMETYSWTPNMSDQLHVNLTSTNILLWKT